MSTVTQSLSRRHTQLWLWKTYMFLWPSRCYCLSIMDLTWHLILQFTPQRNTTEIQNNSRPIKFAKSVQERPSPSVTNLIAVSRLLCSVLIDMLCCSAIIPTLHANCTPTCRTIPSARTEGVKSILAQTVRSSCRATLKNHHYWQ